MPPTTLTAEDLFLLITDPQQTRPTWEDREAEAATVSEMEEWELREELN